MTKTIPETSVEIVFLVASYTVLSAALTGFDVAAPEEPDRGSGRFACERCFLDARR